MPAAAPTSSPTVLHEAYRTLRPGPNGPHGPLPPLLLALTVVTGLVDAFSYLALGHVFVANMTGNVVFLALALGGAPGFSLSASLLALAAFAAGAFAGGLLVHRLRRRQGPALGRVLLVAVLVQAGLVLGALVTAWLSAAPFPSPARQVLIILLGLAMGLQNAAARALAVPDLTTTVLTLTITGIAADSRAAGGAGSRAGRRLLSAAAMFLGVLAGALALRHGATALPLLSAALLLLATGAATAAAVRRADRTGAAWAQRR
ncbi:YoaK family protein [Kitasatospora sp. NPDC008050]|uniref:YoaK family protein n=1 Tax=Kitasatospora sp. NPDC008050 TaxID=3364021 RepID=UPI0036EBA122